MTRRNNDDSTRDLVQQAYAAETEPTDIDVVAGLRDVLDRARHREQSTTSPPTSAEAERGAGTSTNPSIAVDATMLAAHLDDFRAVPDTVTDAVAAVGQPPVLARGGREWFVALALCEPWLTGADEDPRPPSNREIYELIRAWHGHAWNLDRPQRVEDAIRTISALVFDPRDDPCRHAGRLSNVRSAVARGVVEAGWITPGDLAEVEHQAATRKSAER